MKRLAFIVFISLIAAVSAAQGQTPRTAEEYNNRGFERQNSGDLDGAWQTIQKQLN